MQLLSKPAGAAWNRKARLAVEPMISADPAFGGRGNQQNPQLTPDTLAV